MNKKLLAFLFLILLSLSLTQAKLISLDPCGTTQTYEQGNGGNTQLVLENQCIKATIRKNYNPNVDFYDKVNDDYFKLHMMGLEERESDGTTLISNIPFASMGLSGYINQSDNTIYWMNGNTKIGYKLIGNKIKGFAEIDNFSFSNPNSELWLEIKYNINSLGTLEWLSPEVDGIFLPYIIENKTSGQNFFYYQNLGHGQSIILDPLYVVDYSPTPATKLIGDNLIGDDFTYEQIDVTTNMTDNNSATDVYLTEYISPKNVLVNVSTTNDTTTSSTPVLLARVDFTNTDTLNYVIVGSYEINTLDKVNIALYVDGVKQSDSIIKKKDNSDYYSNVLHITKTLPVGSHYAELYYNSVSNIATIRNVVLNVFEVSGFFSSTNDIPQTLETTYTQNSQISGTIPDNSIYLVVASGKFSSEDTGQSAYVQMQIDNTQVNEITQESKDNNLANHYPSFTFFKIFNASMGNHVMNISSKRESSTGGLISNVKLSAMRLDNLEEYHFKEENTLSTTTSSTYQNKTKLSFVANNTGFHLIFANAEFGGSRNDYSAYARLYDGSSTFCESTIEMKETTSPPDYYTFSCQKVVYLVQGNTYTYDLQYRNERSGDTARIKNARVLSVKQFTTENNATMIMGAWNKTYDSNFNYFLTFDKEDARPINFSVFAYIDNDTIYSNNVTYSTSNQGQINIPINNLMSYMENISMPFKQFRLVQDSVVRNPTFVSSLYLREQANDTQSPVINLSSCNVELYPDAIVQYDFTCNQAIEFSCSDITDDVAIDNVVYEIGGVNYSITLQHGHYDHYIYPSANGTINYSWWKIYATDIFNNTATVQVNQSVSYSCDFQQYINITNIQTQNITITEAIVTWDTNNASDSLLHYGLSPTTLNNSQIELLNVFSHDIELSGLLPNTTYFYSVYSSDGFVNQTRSIFNFTTLENITTCIENWVEDSYTCQINDSYFSTFTDTYSCGTYTSLPISNGTYQYCNYCLQDLSMFLGTCTTNNTQSVDWIDNNKTSCCDVTGLSSDCDILTYPFNETTTQSCLFYNNTMSDISCQANPNFNIREKEYCLVHIPLQYANESFKCISSIIDLENFETKQTNPEYRERSSSFIDLKNDPETREYFTNANQLVNFYFTSKNLRTDKSYLLKIECSSQYRTLESNFPISYNFEDTDQIALRGIWLKNSATSLFFIIFVVLIMIAIILFFWRYLIRR